MIDDYLNSKSWPFVEAKNLLKRRKKQIEAKGYALFQTGYGPSGLPHIGTFGEVCRTIMVIQAFKKLSNIPTRLYTFSDDLDGLRKVPENIENSDVLKQNLGKSLTSIPDPFKKFSSFGEHNNEMFKKFLDEFKFDYEFKSSTKLYQSGIFDKSLLKILDNYEKVNELILPTLGEERRKTYSPFLPICPDTGKVLEVPIVEILKEKGEIIYENNGKKIKTSVTGGNCKLQWKVDWAMRWHALEVDFEMFGKDLIPSSELSSKICKTLGTTPPNSFFYELFLDEKGEKISKSKGNGVLIQDWLKYASQESLTFYMYQNPQRAKKLYPEVIPKTVDEYLNFLEKFISQNVKEKLGNPVWHVHDGNPPEEKNVISYAVLLNLVSASNSESQDVIWKFIQNFNPDITQKSHPILNNLVSKAIIYFKDIVKPKKKFRKPNDSELKAFQDLINTLDQISDNQSPAEIQTEVFSIGKKYYEKDKLREWFKTIYEVIFGDEQGPRMGSFIKFYGVQETKKLIEERIK